MTRRNISSSSPYEDVHGYCRAVRVGDQIHVAGTCAAQDCLEGTTTFEQAVSALAIIEQALIDAGASLSDVVRTVIYVTNIDEHEQVSRAHSACFDAVRPVSTMVEVSRLIDPRMTVEIEAYAVVGGDPSGD
jgi:enamine deaminase RidA (YjgF/YER057c/UK114 family)